MPQKNDKWHAVEFWVAHEWCRQWILKDTNVWYLQESSHTKGDRMIYGCQITLHIQKMLPQSML